MNRMEFLSQVDSIAGECTEEQLRYFVRECARTTPEKNREDFLTLLQTAAAGGVSAQPAEELRDAVTRQEACARIMEVLDDIESGDRAIDIEPNEADRYSSEDEFLFEDPDGIMDDVKEACDLAHWCMQVKDYENALALGTKLVKLSIPAVGVGDDNLDLWGASEVLHSSLDLRTLSLDTMTAAYYASECRCEDIYASMRNHDRIMLKDLLQYIGEELPDFPAFLREWISFLGKTADRSYVYNVLEDRYQEALNMLPDSEPRISLVRQFAEQHPKGYLLLLEDSGISDEMRWSLGLEALKEIREKSPLRAEIAIRTAEIAIRTGKSQEELEACWLEAFTSDPCAVRYLRAYLHFRDPKACKEKMDEFVADCQKAAAEDSSMRYQWNRLSPMFRFLRGDAMNAFRSTVCGKNAWSWHSFACGCAYLCLAALYQKVPETPILRGVYSKAMEALSFSKTQYLRGVPQSAIQDLENKQPQLKLQGREELDEDQLFLLCFRQWEAQAVSFTDADAKEILDSLEKVAEEQMYGPATGEMASCYGDCAHLLASVGEVRESLGQAGAKQQILSRFGKAYRRRRSFVAELISCGWNGQ